MSCTESYDWTFTQGEDAVLQLTYKDSSGAAIDLTGYTARSQGRTSYSAATTLFDATTENTQIQITPASGIIVITIPAAETAAMAAPLQGVWDLEIISGSGSVKNLLGGRLRIQPEVTK